MVAVKFIARLDLNKNHSFQVGHFTERHKFNPSPHTALPLALPALSAARLLRRLLARALPEGVP
jgi:hypothetical protein